MSAAGWVDRALEERLRSVTSADSEEGRSLAQALQDASAGGKRFRPVLVASAHQGLGGRRPDVVPVVGAAVELLHTAFVVHDDVIDGDTTRRGRPTVPASFHSAATRSGADPRAAQTYGLAGAVLTGDLALSAAIRAVATAPAPRRVVERMLDLVDHAIAVTATGELADVRFATHTGWPALADVLSAEERKTAVYSFALPLQLGAVLADADEQCVAALADIGRHLGLAFQLRDDLLGVFGDEQVTGKSTLSDLREGKVTVLAVHARRTPEWAEIEPHWGDPELTEERAVLVRRALERAGSRAHVEAMVEEYVGTAADGAARLGLPAELVQWLGSLCVPAATGAA
jgi:geranylgeranyl pyrophosphate synthase